MYWYLRQQFTSLTTSRKFGDIFKNIKIIKGERQTKNLRSILQKSNIAPVHLPQGSFKCKKSNCGTCPYLKETTSIPFISDTGVRDFKLLSNFSCKSKHVVYKITCKGCGTYYIGQTWYIRQRVSNHKFHIFNSSYRHQNVHNHLNHCTGGQKVCFEIVPFYYVKQKTLRARLTVEDHFIREFNPELNA